MRGNALTAGYVKKNLKYSKIPSDEVWREKLIKELISSEVEVNGFSQEEVTEMVEYLCST